MVIAFFPFLSRELGQPIAPVPAGSIGAYSSKEQKIWLGSPTCDRFIFVALVTKRRIVANSKSMF
jgi:hypothetical protein